MWRQRRYGEYKFVSWNPLNTYSRAEIPTLTPDHVLQLLTIDFESFRQQIVGIVNAQLQRNRPDVAPVAVHRRHLAGRVAAPTHRLEHQLIERRQKRCHGPQKK